jgi:hypothetical protein
VEAQLRQAGELIAGCVSDGLSIDDLPGAVDAARLVQRQVEAFLLGIAHRADELADSRGGPPANETLLGTGEVSARQARREAGRSGVARLLPQLGSALDVGRVGASHLDVVGRALRRLDHDEQEALVARQDELVDAAARLPVDSFQRYVQRVVDSIRGDRGAGTLEEQRERSELRSWVDKNGMGHVHLLVDPERHETVAQAVQREMRAMVAAAAASDETLALDANLAAAALVELVQQGNGRFGRPHLIIVTNPAAGDAETLDGTPLPPAVVAEHRCDAVTREVTLDGAGVPLRVGRERRTATGGQWAALQALYRTCAWFGCDRPISWCQAHHVRFWESDGPTDIDNLVPLCHFHHQQVHRRRWRLELTSDRTLRITRPDGTAWRTSRPDRRPLGGAPVGAPTRQHSRPSPTKEANPEQRARAYPRIPLGAGRRRPRRGDDWAAPSGAHPPEPATTAGSGADTEPEPPGDATGSPVGVDPPADTAEAG